MARSSQAAMGLDNGATDDIYETKIQNLRSDVTRSHKAKDPRNKAAR